MKDFYNPNGDHGGPIQKSETVYETKSDTRILDDHDKFWNPDKLVGVITPDGCFSFNTKRVKAMNFSSALIQLKAGECLSRKGWNGKNMFVFLVRGSTFKVNREPLLSILGEGTEVNYRGHIDMRMTDGTIMVWHAAQVDMLAEDWEII